MDEEQNNQTTSAPNERKGFNITSMILGIISILAFCWWYVSIPAGIIAIIFSIAGKNDAGRGMGVAGLVCGIIGLVLCVVIYVLAIIGVATLGAAASAM
ncbi:MAG: DUF4190 domain-containing protein [Clostridia bacterium]|nr:DUF4190 domain-containing protein [Clostridia bacterium]